MSGLGGETFIAVGHIRRPVWRGLERVGEQRGAAISPVLFPLPHPA